MLRPRDLLVAEYGIATKPSVGYEKKLFLSPKPHLELGVFEIRGANSGVWTPNTVDYNQLSANPMELLAVLQAEVPDAGADIVLTVSGTDQTGAARVFTATFKSPAYAESLSTRVFKPNWAAEGIPPADGQKCKTIGNISVTNHANAGGLKFSLMAVPALDTFVQVLGRVRMEYDPLIPEPVPIQEGRYGSYWVKPGMINPGSFTVTGKITNEANGLARFNGVTCTALVKCVKEDKVHVSNEFFFGLNYRGVPSVEEGTEPEMLSVNGMFQDLAVVIAQGT